MYTSVYLDAALVTKLQFTTYVYSADVGELTRRERALGITNGVLYCIWIGVLLLDLFADGRLAETCCAIALSTAIAIALALSMPKLRELLHAMGQSTHDKTLLAQLVLLGLIAFFGIISFVLKVKFLSDCS